MADTVGVQLHVGGVGISLFAEMWGYVSLFCILSIRMLWLDQLEKTICVHDIGGELTATD